MIGTEHKYLPPIRRELARSMKRLGYTQKRIASLLGVTEAAVSQYTHKKRAAKDDFGTIFEKHFDEAAKRIVDHHSLVEETQRLIKLIEKKVVIT